MSILVSILGLAFLILIHEAGHFFVARAVGMNPRKFYIGFPPAVAKTKRNGIEYGIGAIPLGGYVKIPGMHRPAAGDLDVHFGRAVEEEPALRTTLPEWRFEVPAGGLSLWIELDAPLSAALAAIADRHGMRLAAGPRFGVDGAFERFVRVPYALPAPVLEDAVARLAVAWRSVTESAPPAVQPAPALVA